ncbi:uncharacterized protein LOC141911188 [Tubulanus polymorphus]|uniref:uncharacterized protein LOC141911188 n=1 Tax=Tubulanus polymorphus TaxID=672921 RepID=UPI003DA55B35
MEFDVVEEAGAGRGGDHQPESLMTPGGSADDIMDLNFTPFDLDAEFDVMNSVDAPQPPPPVANCQSCIQLRNEMSKMLQDHELNFKTLKQKIISTDLLIKKYNTKSQDYNNQTKQLEEVTKKLDKVNYDSSILERQLKSTLSEVEPLRQKLKEWDLDREKYFISVQQLEDKVSAAESVSRQYETVGLEAEAVREKNERKIRDLSRDAKSLEEKCKRLETAEKKLKALYEESKSNASSEKKKSKQLGKLLEKANERIRQYEETMHQNGITVRKRRQRRSLQKGNIDSAGKEIDGDENESDDNEDEIVAKNDESLMTVKQKITNSMMGVSSPGRRNTGRFRQTSPVKQPSPRPARRVPRQSSPRAARRAPPTQEPSVPSNHPRQSISNSPKTVPSARRDNQKSSKIARNQKRSVATSAERESGISIGENNPHEDETLLFDEEQLEENDALLNQLLGNDHDDVTNDIAPPSTQASTNDTSALTDDVAPLSPRVGTYDASALTDTESEFDPTDVFSCRWFKGLQDLTDVLSPLPPSPAMELEEFDSSHQESAETTDSTTYTLPKRIDSLGFLPICENSRDNHVTIGDDNDCYDKRERTVVTKQSDDVCRGSAFTLYHRQSTLGFDVEAVKRDVAAGIDQSDLREEDENSNFSREECRNTNNNKNTDAKSAFKKSFGFDFAGDKAPSGGDRENRPSKFGRNEGFEDFASDNALPFSSAAPSGGDRTSQSTSPSAGNDEHAGAATSRRSAEVTMSGNSAENSWNSEVEKSNIAKLDTDGNNETVKTLAESINFAINSNVFKTSSDKTSTSSDKFCNNDNNVISSHGNNHENSFVNFCDEIKSANNENDDDINREKEEMGGRLNEDECNSVLEDVKDDEIVEKEKLDCDNELIDDNENDEDEKNDLVSDDSIVNDDDEKDDRMGDEEEGEQSVCDKTITNEDCDVDNLGTVQRSTPGGRSTPRGRSIPDELSTPGERFTSELSTSSECFIPREYSVSGERFMSGERSASVERSNPVSECLSSRERSASVERSTNDQPSNPIVSRRNSIPNRTAGILTFRSSPVYVPSTVSTVLPPIIRASQSAITIVSPETSGLPAAIVTSDESNSSIPSGIFPSSSSNRSPPLSPTTRMTPLSPLPISPFLISGRITPISPLPPSPQTIREELLSPLPGSPPLDNSDSTLTSGSSSSSSCYSPNSSMTRFSATSSIFISPLSGGNNASGSVVTPAPSIISPLPITPSAAVGGSTGSSSSLRRQTDDSENNVVSRRNLEVKFVEEKRESETESSRDSSDRILVNNRVIKERSEDENYRENIENLRQEEPQFDSQPKEPQFDSQLEEPQFDSQLEEPQFDSQLEEPQFDSQLEEPQFDSQLEEPQFDSQLEEPQFEQTDIHNRNLNSAPPEDEIELVECPAGDEGQTTSCSTKSLLADGSKVDDLETKPAPTPQIEAQNSKARRVKKPNSETVEVLAQNSRTDEVQKPQTPQATGHNSQTPLAQNSETLEVLVQNSRNEATRGSQTPPVKAQNSQKSSQVQNSETLKGPNLNRSKKPSDEKSAVNVSDVGLKRNLSKQKVVAPKIRRKSSENSAVKTNPKTTAETAEKINSETAMISDESNHGDSIQQSKPLESSRDVGGMGRRKRIARHPPPNIPLFQLGAASSRITRQQMPQQTSRINRSESPVTAKTVPPHQQCVVPTKVNQSESPVVAETIETKEAVTVQRFDSAKAAEDDHVKVVDCCPSGGVNNNATKRKKKKQKKRRQKEEMTPHENQGISAADESMEPPAKRICSPEPAPAAPAPLVGELKNHPDIRKQTELQPNHQTSVIVKTMAAPETITVNPGKQSRGLKNAAFGCIQQQQQQQHQQQTGVNAAPSQVQQQLQQQQQQQTGVNAAPSHVQQQQQQQQQRAVKTLAQLVPLPKRKNKRDKTILEYLQTEIMKFVKTPNVTGGSSSVETIVEKLKNSDPFRTELLVEAIIKVLLMLPSDLLALLYGCEMLLKPCLSQAERKMADFCRQFYPLMASLKEQLLKSLSKRILFDKTIPEVPRMGLCRFFGGLCHDDGSDLEIARVLIFDLIYHDVTHYPQFILSVISGCPRVLRKTFIKLNPDTVSLVTLMEWMIPKKCDLLPQQYDRHSNVKKAFMDLCRWKESKQTPETFIQIIVCQIINSTQPQQQPNEVELYQNLRCIELLCSYQGWEWTNSYYIRNIVWPKLQAWSVSPINNRTMSDRAIASLLQSLGPVCLKCPTKNKMAVVETMSVLKILLQSMGGSETIPVAVQEGALSALLMLSAYDPQLVGMVTVAWVDQHRAEISETLRRNIYQFVIAFLPVAPYLSSLLNIIEPSEPSSTFA